VDGSRLVLLAPPGAARERAVRAFASDGVAPGRVELVGRRPREDYLASYGGIDVALDTFPYNGHTTSLDSLWMGVPVVTLVGETLVGRAGLSQVMNLGLPELAATTPEEYVRIAVDLASDLDRLERIREAARSNGGVAADGRAALRSQLRASLPRCVASLVPVRKCTPGVPHWPHFASACRLCGPLAATGLHLGHGALPGPRQDPP
jgi:Glycosyl transferase family 41